MQESRDSGCRSEVCEWAPEDLAVHAFLLSTLQKPRCPATCRRVMVHATYCKHHVPRHYLPDRTCVVILDRREHTPYLEATTFILLHQNARIDLPATCLRQILDSDCRLIR